MRRVLILMVIVVGSVSGCAMSEDDAVGDRCQHASSAEKDVRVFAEKLAEQDAAFDKSKVLIHLADKKASETELGYASLQAESQQLVSDSPRCFSVTKVAEARRALEVYDAYGPQVPEDYPVKP